MILPFLALLLAADEIRPLPLRDPTRSLPAGAHELIACADAASLRNELEARITHKLDPLAVPLTPAERKATAERMAATLARQVDFSKEKIVWVRWTTGGPPDGRLLHEVRGRAVVFYVEAPPPGDRGERALSHNDFFAVPAGLAPSLERGERPAK